MPKRYSTRHVELVLLSRGFSKLGQSERPAAGLTRRVSQRSASSQSRPPYSGAHMTSPSSTQPRARTSCRPAALLVIRWLLSTLRANLPGNCAEMACVPALGGLSDAHARERRGPGYCRSLNRAHLWRQGIEGERQARTGCGDDHRPLACDASDQWPAVAWLGSESALFRDPRMKQC